MTEPMHHFGHALNPQAVGQPRPRDHDHGNPQHAGRVDLGARASAAGIAGDDPGDAARAQHLQLAIKRERSARHDHIRGKGQGRFGWIDETQRVDVMRLRRKWRDVLAADGEEYFCRAFRKNHDDSVDVGDLDPAVAGRLGPGRALQRNQWRARLRARFDRMTAHLGSKGVRRVDQMRDACVTDVVGKSGHSAKAADAGRQRLVGGGAGAAAIGVDSFDARARDLRCEQARIGCSAQNEGANHV